VWCPKEFFVFYLVMVRHKAFLFFIR